MRRALTLLVLTAACLLMPAIASAHPLGNFTINRYAGIRVQPDRVLVHYVVDMAEIPTFQERAAVEASGAEAYAAATCARVAGDLALTVDGRAAALGAGTSAVTFPPGAAGLATTRLTCDLSAPLPAIRSGSHALDFRDDAFAGRLGWREITAVGDRSTLKESSVPEHSVSAELTGYPQDLLTSPLDVRGATVRFEPGGAAAAGSGVVGSLLPRGVDRVTEAFQSFLARRSVTVPLVAIALSIAILLGALHAFAPGHGKTVMAAYLVGRRGTIRQGILMGLTITATHTAGVLALGLFVTVSSTIAPERLYPVFGVASGLMLATIGASLLRRALHARRSHEHPHGHDHPETVETRRLLAIGFAGGLVPSPSAVVVLLGALAIGRVWLGAALVFAYGLGMAATLSGAGLLLVRLRRFAEARATTRRPRLALLTRVVPITTASVITIVGMSVAARGALAL